MQRSLSTGVKHSHAPGKSGHEPLYIGLDDTDSLTSRGTGHLARRIGAAIADQHFLQGVTRHQLLFDPRVPYTAKNSCAAILLETNGKHAHETVIRRVRSLMREHFVPGSDPGLCVAKHVPSAIIAFGRRVQEELVTQEEARSLAAFHGVELVGLGGTEDGVIGALAAVGLAASGDDGRYVMVGSSRQLKGLYPASSLSKVGISEVRTLDGRRVTTGLIHTDKLRPARRGAQPVLFVEWAEGYWRPLKLD